MYVIPFSILIISSIYSLPPTIDQKVAVEAFKRHRGLLRNLIRHCLPSLTNYLIEEDLISNDVKETACNEIRNISVRVMALLDCVQDKIEAEPSYFTKFVHILELEPFLRGLAKTIVSTYMQ